MVFNMFHVALLGALFIYTWRGAHRAVTRRLSMIPLTMCGIEIFLAGVLDVTAFPVLGILLAAAAALLCVCIDYVTKKEE